MANVIVEKGGFDWSRRIEAGDARFRIRDGGWRMWLVAGRLKEAVDRGGLIIGDVFEIAAHMGLALDYSGLLDMGEAFEMDVGKIVAPPTSEGLDLVMACGDSVNLGGVELTRGDSGELEVRPTMPELEGDVGLAERVAFATLRKYGYGADGVWPNLLEGRNFGDVDPTVADLLRRSSVVNVLVEAGRTLKEPADER